MRFSQKKLSLFMVLGLLSTQLMAHSGYHREATLVTEFQEIDLMGEHDPTARVTNSLMHSPGNRYVHNPVHNLVVNIFLSAANGGVEPAGAPTKDTMIYLPSYQVSLPECGACGYLSLIVPQYFTSAWLRGSEYKPGIATNLYKAHQPGYGGNITEVDFSDQSHNACFQQMNHHSIFSAVSFPSFYTASPQDRSALYNAVAHAQCHGSEHEAMCKALVVGGLNALFPSNMPSFPVNSIPEQRPITNCQSAIDAYPKALMPYSQTLSTVAGSGREFTSVEFPYGYAFQIGGGDITPVNWHWTNPANIDPATIDGTVVIRNDFHVDFDFKKLYETLLQMLGNNAAGFIQSKFAAFGFDWNQEPEVNYTNLHGTWASTSLCHNGEFSIPSGKSKSYGIPSFVNTKARIVYVQAHCHDHTDRLELWKETSDGKKELLNTFVPDLSQTLAAHDGLREYSDYGPINSRVNLHRHDYNAHLAAGGLQSSVWAPGENGPVIDKPLETMIRTVGYYDNPHCQPTDNMAILIAVWEALDEIPSTSPKISSCSHHIN